MKRKSFILTLCLALIAALTLTAAVSAHTVSIGDTSRVDWFGRGPSANNIGEIVRDTAGRGEFVWTDAKTDQRVASPVGATGNITREADLAKFNITADATNLYFLAKMERISGLGNDPSPELMIALDTDAAHTGGLAALPDGVATDVDGAAKWEYVVQTQFTKTDPAVKPTIYTNASSSSCASCAAQLVNAAVRQGSFIEIAVPWSQVGGLPSAQNTIRFTVLTHYSDKRVPSDGITSKAIDVLSPLSTVAELTGDNAINAHIDLHFSASGEVFAPLLISEFLPDPPTSRDPEGEWIEIFNPTAFDINLSGYKVGDQAYRTGSQGMVQLPNQILAAGQAVVVANKTAVFQSRYPSVPANKIIDLTTLAPYTSWATGNISLQNTNNGQPFKESLSLLDPQDTIVDLVQYTTPIQASGLDPDNKPVVLSSTSVGPNTSYDRCPSGQDTNDSTFDFVAHTLAADQTPGVACLGVPGVDLRIAKTGPESVAVGSTIQYTITFNNAGTGPQSASTVVLTDTLPAGMTCVSQTASVSVGAIAFAGTCPGGTSLSWNISTLAPGASGTIVLSVLVDGGLAPDTTLINTAGISSNPAEAPATLQNNLTTHTTITEGPPDLAVSSTWPETSTPAAGSQFSYTIDYTNIGADDASDITIVDHLPSNVTLVSASAPGATFNNATTGDLTWHVDSLSYLESGTITLRVKIADTVPVGTTLTNQISIASNPPDATPANNAESKSVVVGQSAILLPFIAR